MTFDEALAKVGTYLDVMIEQAHEWFEQSLIDNHCPPEDVEDLFAYERDYMQAWRERSLAAVREKLLEPFTPWP